MPAPLKWTPEMDAKLRECRDAGMSYYGMHAAGVFGGLSANAIVGRAMRIGLTGAGRPEHHRGPHEKMVRRPAKPKKPKGPPRFQKPRHIAPFESRLDAAKRIAKGVGVPVLKPSICEPIGGKVGWTMPERHECRWIFGEGDKREWCGHPVVDGRPWCAEHYPRTLAPRVLEDA